MLLLEWAILTQHYHFTHGYLNSTFVGKVRKPDFRVLARAWVVSQFGPNPLRSHGVQFGGII
jgi:hypothetical protein